jgi:hypothetical protein
MDIINTCDTLSAKTWRGTLWLGTDTSIKDERVKQVSGVRVAREFTPGFSGVRVARSWVFCG